MKEKIINNFKDSKLTMSTDNYLVIDGYFAIKLNKVFSGIEMTQQKIENLIDGSSKKETFLEISAYNFLEKSVQTECDNCFGKGTIPIMEKCRDCDGDGEVEICDTVGDHQYSTFVECKECDGDGEVEVKNSSKACKYCYSTGTMSNTLEHEGVKLCISHKILVILKDLDLILRFSSGKQDLVLIKKNDETIGILAQREK